MRDLGVTVYLASLFIAFVSNGRRRGEGKRDVLLIILSAVLS
jgi:hypothetical protein